MDQSLLNWVFAFIGGLLGWLVKVVWDAIKELKADMKMIERDLPQVYVRKDDFKSAIHEMREDMRETRLSIKEGFNKVETALSNLARRIDLKEDKEG
jgi:hypothetical protein